MTDQINSISRQWVACAFKPGDQRSYTYHNDGEPVAIGDEVMVETAKGTARVTVVGLPEKEPSFPTKAIKGLAPPPVDAVHDEAKAASARMGQRVQSRSEAAWPGPRGEGARDAYERDLLAGDDDGRVGE